MSDNLPQELLIEILIRVPVKPLMCFTVVSKSWYALITSPTFITTHLTKIKHHDDPNLMLLRRYTKDDKKENYTLHPDDAAEDDNGNDTFALRSAEVHLPFKSQIGYFRIVGSCNGLVCLSDDLFGISKPTILWNPSIRKSVTSPSPTINSPLPYMFVLGFGVDSQGDYKVVRIVYHKHGDFEFALPPEVEVYTLSMGFWRRIMNVGLKFYITDFTWSQAFRKGALHWIAYAPRGNDIGGSFCSLIVAFDLSKEVFYEILLPDALSSELATNLCISVHGDSLAVIKYHRAVDIGSCSIWVMKEYGVLESWTKIYSFDLVEGIEKVVGFRKNGDILMSMESNKLVSYDPKTSVIKDLGISGSPRSFYVDSFPETLVLLERQNGVVEEEGGAGDAHPLQEEVGGDGCNEEC